MAMVYLLQLLLVVSTSSKKEKQKQKSNTRKDNLRFIIIVVSVRRLTININNIFFYTNSTNIISLNTTLNDDGATVLFAVLAAIVC